MFWMMIDVCPKLYSAPIRTHVFDLKFFVKVFEIPIYNQCVRSFGLVFGMTIDIGPKFYSLPPPPMRVTYRSRSKARFHVTVTTQINKSVIYFIVRRNVKFGCSEC